MEEAPFDVGNWKRLITLAEGPKLSEQQPHMVNAMRARIRCTTVATARSDALMPSVCTNLMWTRITYLDVSSR
ncbi:hypothetical protein PR003_g3432 [Phytophthora rubi]|uniref:Uncharacterized protein n=1 Tax=Phytophthora rubi TaxID=129364 RepID=A0A6A4G6K9_9STRA|nr:hypothetical protein PR003_g3432 [Phytophthora rubi]